MCLSVRESGLEDCMCWFERCCVMMLFALEDGGEDTGSIYSRGTPAVSSTNLTNHHHQDWKGMFTIVLEMY